MLSRVFFFCKFDIWLRRLHLLNSHCSLRLDSGRKLVDLSGYGFIKHLFDLRLFGFDCFLFLLVSGMGCGFDCGTPWTFLLPFFFTKLQASLGSSLFFDQVLICVDISSN